MDQPSLQAELRASIGTLFPRRGDRRRLSALILLGAVVSVLELAVAQLFSRIILDGGGDADPIVLVGAFIAAFTALKLLGYAQTRYKLTVLQASIGASGSPSLMSESWRWATGMELVGVLSQLARLAVVCAVVALLSPWFGAVTALCAVTAGGLLTRSVDRHLDVQRDFVGRQRTPGRATSAEKVEARVMAGERAGILATAPTILLMAVLVALSAAGHVAAGQAIVLFVAVRMTGTIYSGVANGMMRFTRAWVYAQ